MVPAVRLRRLLRPPRGEGLDRQTVRIQFLLLLHDELRKAGSLLLLPPPPLLLLLPLRPQPLRAVVKIENKYIRALTSLKVC